MWELAQVVGPIALPIIMRRAPAVGVDEVTNLCCKACHCFRMLAPLLLPSCRFGSCMFGIGCHSQ